jgi:putative oxidoreductase
MKNFGDLVTRLYARLDGTQWVARLVVRIAIGLEFFGSGLGKLGRLSGLIEYFRSLGIPAPEIQAPFVASTELVCGVLIAIGLATRPAALMLCGVMTVAIVTAAAPEKHITANWHGLLEFFYLPEVLLFLLLAGLVLAGPGRASVDAWFGARRSRRVERSSPATPGAAVRHHVERPPARA